MRLPYTSEINEDQNAGICNKCNWPRFRIKHLLREIDLRTENGMEPLFSMRQTKGLIIHSEVSDKPIKYEDLVGYKIVRPGLIVMNRMRASIGLFAASYSHGLVSPDYAVFQPQKPVNLDYLVRFFQTPLMKTIFRKESKGMGTGSSGFLRLYTDRFGAIPISLPPLAEQNHIVDVVKSLDRKISRFLRNKRRLIRLLKEQKQNIINRTVTRGLDPKVKLKPSGVEWLGDIPEHWEIKRLKNITQNINDQTMNKNSRETYIALEHVEPWTGRILFSEVDAPIDSQVKCFQKEDILFGKLRPYLAKVASPCCSGVCVGEFLVLRSIDKRIAPKFTEYKLRSKSIIDLVSSSTYGAKMPRADWEFIGNIRFSYPPKDEQQLIVDYIDSKSLEIDRAISRAEREIELMTEYRTRLISDVVTGKVDVRDIDVPEISEEELLAPEEEAEGEEGLSEVEIPGDEDGEADE